ncbi:MAG: tetratricopeptide repeat protein [Prevotellaceae bacterium]|nr:tetratricopeptide repeat protein [Prevotellaceae bacterium]
MKRIITILFAAFVCCMVNAQPDKWVKKASKAVFTLKTFNADGSLIGSGNGFFITADGVAVSSYTPFRGAAKAVVIDAMGKEYEVKSIIGANDVYDIAKFRVDATKCQTLRTAPAAVENTSLWLLPYNAKNAYSCTAAKVKSVQKVQNDYDYYTLEATAPENTVGCPYLNANGEVVGIQQQSSSDDNTTQYAVGAAFATGLKMTGLSLNDPALKATSIKKDLPDELDQAILTLYLASTLGDAQSFVGLVDDFIAKFPQAPDGYSYKAQIMAAQDNYPEADKYMKLAIDNATDKAEARYNYAKMMYQNLIYFYDSASHAWSYEQALEQAEQAVALDPQLPYLTQKAQLLFACKRYADSYAAFQDVIGKGGRTAECFYGAARCKEQLNDTTACLALLDSAVATFSKPYLKEAAPYIYARAQALAESGKYRLAVNDYNEYENLMISQVNSEFYYIRSQVEAKARLFQQALNDLDKAIDKSPDILLYRSEKASLQIRVHLLDQAIETASECIRLFPDSSDGYLFLGLAQCLKGDKVQGVGNLLKAKDLGDAQADTLIEKYGK